MLLKGECTDDPTEVLIVAQSRFQIVALHATAMRASMERLIA